MVPKKCSVSVPGSLMLMGEHAVLRGHPALVMAINRRLQVHFEARKDKTIYIQSALGQLQCHLDDIPSDPTFRFVLAAIQAQGASLKQGFDIHIVSAFSDQLGLGSSAAVSVACLAGMHYLVSGKTLEKQTLFQQARALIRGIQGLGSGADAAASVYGGVLYYDPAKDSIEPLYTDFPFVTVYSGYKEKTSKVVHKVNLREKNQATLMKSLFETMGLGVNLAKEAIEQHDKVALGDIMNIQQGLMNALGVSSPALEDLLSRLRKLPGILGAKISGSGLGDCVIALGKPLLDTPLPVTLPEQVIDLTLSETGIVYALD